MIALYDVSIRYGAHVAVRDATFDLPGGAVGLLGRNGAGKTSILRALLGIVAVTTGRMQILDLPGDASTTEIRRRVGYMPERDCHVPGLSGFESVALAARLSGLPQREAFRRAHEVLWLTGVEEQRYRSVGGYSTGMRQKIKLAIALVHDPDVLFLDEPTNGLDPRGRTDMLDLVIRLTRDLGKSVVLSSHILQDIERVCSHVVLMEGGRVLANGPLDSLTAHAIRSHDLTAPGVDRSLLLAELNRHGVTGVEDIGRDSFRFSLSEGLTPSQIFAAVAQCGGTVRRFVEHRRSLEDVFIGAVHGIS